MFSFLRQKRSCRETVSFHSGDADSTLADDATEVGSVLDKKNYTDEEKLSPAREKSGLAPRSPINLLAALHKSPAAEKSDGAALVYYGKYTLPAKIFHPDFRYAGDIVIFCYPPGTDSKKHRDPHVLQGPFSLVENLRPVHDEAFKVIRFAAEPKAMDAFLRFIHEWHPDFPDPLPWTVANLTVVNRLLRQFGGQPATLQIFGDRLYGALPHIMQDLGDSPTYDQVFAVLRLALDFGKVSPPDSPKSNANIVMRAVVKQAHRACEAHKHKPWARTQAPEDGAAISGWTLLYEPYIVPADYYRDIENAKVWDLCFGISRYCKHYGLDLSEMTVMLRGLDPSGHVFVDIGDRSGRTPLKLTL